MVETLHLLITTLLIFYYIDNMSSNCIFCKIIRGTIPSVKVYESKLSYAFLDIGPLSEGL